MQNERLNRSFIIFLFAETGLAAFLFRFSDNFLISCLLLVTGLLILGVRTWQLKYGKPKAMASLDFSPLQKLNLASLAHWLKQNVRGHDVMINDVVRQLQSNISLARPGRCLGTFLIVGPTGTGKSFLAQLVSEALFPGVEPVVLRMNQFKNPDDVFTLIGAPPGRAGFELGGALTRPVSESPFRVVILDELEKAHPDLFDCLYDILDTGSCREKSTGNVVDFSGCVFFATSNAAIEELRIAKTQAKDSASADAKYREALARASSFNKAFIARWERVYFFDTLSDLHVAEVACLNITKYWKQFGMNVRYASPELILQTVLRNREFQEFGVRQLMGFIRMKSDPIVQAARAQGQKEVHLGINDAGEFVLGRQSATGTSKKVS